MDDGERIINQEKVNEFPCFCTNAKIDSSSLSSALSYVENYGRKQRLGEQCCTLLQSNGVIDPVPQIVSFQNSNSCSSSKQCKQTETQRTLSIEETGLFVIMFEHHVNTFFADFNSMIVLFFFGRCSF